MKFSTVAITRHAGRRIVLPHGKSHATIAKYLKVAFQPIDSLLLF